MQLNRIQMLRLFMGHWEMLYALGQLAEQLADPKVDSVSKKWAVIKPAGDMLAPEIDQIINQLHGVTASGHGMAALSSGMSTEAELEESLLSGFKHAYIEMHVQDATRGMVAAAGASEEDKKKVQESIAQSAVEARAAATEKARRFDGHWLKAALQVWTTLSPILLPLLMKSVG
jgi:hypothetical protein